MNNLNDNKVDCEIKKCMNPPIEDFFNHLVDSLENAHNRISDLENDEAKQPIPYEWISLCLIILLLFITILILIIFLYKIKK